MKELIEYIATALVDDASLIEVNEVEGNQTNIIELRVAKSDIGKVIGRRAVRRRHSDDIELRCSQSL